MATIELTRGLSARVDAADLPELQQYLWRAVKKTNVWYAVRVEELGAVDGRRVRRTVPMHRHLLRGVRVDHENGDGLDNRRKNLRLCTHAQNMRNARKVSRGSSRYKGVSWHAVSGKWQAQIQVDKKRRCLGYFVDEVEAARAYDQSARKNFGAFAVLNFPRGGRGQR